MPSCTRISKYCVTISSVPFSSMLHLRNILISLSAILHLHTLPDVTVPDVTNNYVTTNRRYLAKYVACPPIAVRRIVRYDGGTVTYSEASAWV